MSNRMEVSMTLQGGKRVWMGSKGFAEKNWFRDCWICLLAWAENWLILTRMSKYGNWDTEVKKLEVKISLRYRRGGSAVSAHNLSLGHVRKPSGPSLGSVFE